GDRERTLPSQPRSGLLGPVALERRLADSQGFPGAGRAGAFEGRVGHPFGHPGLSLAPAQLVARFEPEHRRMSFVEGVDLALGLAEIPALARARAADRIGAADHPDARFVAVVRDAQAVRDALIRAHEL